MSGWDEWKVIVRGGRTNQGATVWPVVEVKHEAERGGVMVDEWMSGSVGLEPVVCRGRGRASWVTWDARRWLGMLRGAAKHCWVR